VVKQCAQLKVDAKAWRSESFFCDRRGVEKLKTEVIE